MKIITTSWDDGFPKDFKLAELLDKYSLPGTFYIPKNNAEHAVMDEKSIVELGKRFEIGGHTLNHVRLYSNRSAAFLEDEITGCFNWITDLTTCQPVSFCFPGGVFSDTAIDAVYHAGFKVLRTTELLSTA
ncbi:MAG: polysaccharide deacetylase, partial [Sphingobacteriaceae bacterium]